jgi:hypothetical protein
MLEMGILIFSEILLGRSGFGKQEEGIWEPVHQRRV